jgi:hypothetical protein
MQTALILMTILGCNDSVSDCQYIATLDERWSSVELCDSVSEKQLGAYANANYPMVVAVCQTQEQAAMSPNPKPRPPAGAIVPAPQTASSETPAAVEAEHRTLASRAMERVKSVLPTSQGMRSIITTPVHFVSDGYSWVAKKFQ